MPPHPAKSMSALALWTTCLSAIEWNIYLAQRASSAKTSAQNHQRGGASRTSCSPLKALVHFDRLLHWYRSSLQNLATALRQTQLVAQRFQRNEFCPRIHYNQNVQILRLCESQTAQWVIIFATCYLVMLVSDGWFCSLLEHNTAPLLGNFMQFSLAAGCRGAVKAASLR